ncbi:GAR1 [Ecytonucleospora hepatopenaei]|uniref:H/ACA ribonucleoprotein complex subunit n=1 Tax=Ecytonucleospora hepatopenaei TaxID=646526 RepID=A0A1W0E6P0_9MICR|nr:GAR1 [Ecytonucleospora hepatopenaei]
MRQFNKNKRAQSFSGEMKLLGEYMHSCGDLIVCKLVSKNVPYPNAPVFSNKKQIGSVDEIFGALDDPYISIKTESKELHKEGIKFETYKEKFLPKERLLPREEQLALKEKEDKEIKEQEKKGQFQKGNKKFGGKKEFRRDKFARIKKEKNLK